MGTPVLIPRMPFNWPKVVCGWQHCMKLRDIALQLEMAGDVMCKHWGVVNWENSIVLWKRCVMNVTDVLEVGRMRCEWKREQCPVTVKKFCNNENCQ